MTVAEMPREMTAKKFLAMPDSIAYELVDGALLERHMGAESSSIAVQIMFLLKTFLKSSGERGHLFESEATLQCFPLRSKKTLRRADVCFVRAGRFPEECIPKGTIRLVPDLIVEVVSPGDLAAELEEKIEQYRSVNVPLIWVVFPNTRSVRVYRAGGQSNDMLLSENDQITGDDILPGFTCAVKEFFE